VFIDPGDPNNSMIYSVATLEQFLCGTPRTPHPIDIMPNVSTADRETLRCWIAAGASP
jgi:hypothetical protein